MVQNTQKSQAGVYLCTASNFLGNDYKTIAVDVWCKYITRQNVDIKISCACFEIYTLFNDSLFDTSLNSRSVADRGSSCRFILNRTLIALDFFVVHHARYLKILAQSICGCTKYVKLITKANNDRVRLR